MNDRPTPSLDPDKLKVERHEVDLGTDTETGNDKVGLDSNDKPQIDDTTGATPPAR